VCREGAAPVVKDGCRFHGSLTVNKVAGNFHITAGKYVVTHTLLRVSCIDAVIYTEVLSVECCPGCNPDTSVRVLE